MLYDRYGLYLNFPQITLLRLFIPPLVVIAVVMWRRLCCSIGQPKYVP